MVGNSVGDLLFPEEEEMIASIHDNQRAAGGLGVDPRLLDGRKLIPVTQDEGARGAGK